jgi:DNA-binding transcriptional ArsR family regulator
MVESTADLSAVFMALADPTRRQIVRMLAERGPQAVSELARPFGMSLQAVSKHISVLARAGVVLRRRIGRSHVCSLDSSHLSEASAWIDHYRQFWDANLERLEMLLDPGDES